MTMTAEMRRKKSQAEKPIRLDGDTAAQVRRGFGIDPAALHLEESETVRAMGARAVAKGNVIQFAPGEFSPDTREGMETLGHELEHVRGQAAGEVPMTGGLLEQPIYEAAADRAGEAFASGSLSAAGPVVAPANAAAAPAQMKKKAGKPVKIPGYQKLSKEGRAQLKNLQTQGYDYSQLRGVDVRQVQRDAMRGIMDQKMANDRPGAHELMKKGYEEFLLPGAERVLDRETGSSKEGLTAKIGTEVFRKDTAFSAANGRYWNTLLDTEGSGKALREQNLPEFNAEKNYSAEQMEAYLLPILSGLKEKMGSDDVRTAFQTMDTSMQQLDFWKNNELLRKRTNLNNTMLRSIAPLIMNRTQDALGFNERGVRELMTPQQEMENAFSIKASGFLQKAANAYLMEAADSDETGPISEGMRGIFDQMIGLMSAPVSTPAPTAAAPAAPSPAPEAAPSYDFSQPGEKVTPDYMNAELPEVLTQDMPLPQRMKFARLQLEKYKGDKENTRNWAGIMAGLQKEEASSAAPKKKKGNWLTRLFSRKG